MWETQRGEEIEPEASVGNVESNDAINRMLDRTSSCLCEQQHQGDTWGDQQSDTGGVCSAVGCGW